MLFEGQRVFGFDAAEPGYGKAAAWVALQVFDVGSGSCGALLQGLDGAVAELAAHEFGALSERFVEGAGQPAAANFYLALGHDGRPGFGGHEV